MDKHKLIKGFMDALFEPENRRLDKTVEELDRVNREVTGSLEWGFMWQGQVFVPKSAPSRPNQVKSLHFHLRNQGNFLLKDIQQVKDDKQFIHQIMYLLIKECTTVDDIRDALPDSLVELSSDLRSIPRSNEAGYTLRTDRHRRQFQQAIDKIDFYAATRLMY